VNLTAGGGGRPIVLSAARPQCRCWVISGQTIAGQNPLLSAVTPIAIVQGITGNLANACFYACHPGIIGGGVIMNRGSKFVPFCVLTIILTASFPARANTIIFQCGMSFAVDLKNSTVNNQPATINATAIDWQLIPGPANGTGIVSYHIDRTTGILTENFTYHLPNGSTQSDDPTTYHCTVGSARPMILRFRR
jgi:hypothetical protein